MLQISNYDVFIFDCDGVILDSNQLKIKAMEQAIIKSIGSHSKISNCIDYFKKNFGSSRFHHVDYFVNEVFCLSGNEKDKVYNNILSNYSEQCKALYLTCNLTPGILDFITSLNGKVYVASGSEQTELRQVFEERKLDSYFEKIYGSPVAKVELVATIRENEPDKKIVMFGDALSDLRAASHNLIDFVAYLPFSNVTNELKEESLKRGYTTINSWSLNQ